MNRANYGNITTNGMQIVSVGATTASRMLGHAEQSLNNKAVEPELTPEQKQYQEEENYIKQMRHNQQYEQAKLYEKGLKSSEQRMSEKELTTVREADKQRKIDKANLRLSGGEEMKQHMTPEEASAYEGYRAEKALKEMNEGDEEEVSIDEAMGADSEQKAQLKQYVFNNVKYLEKLKNKNIGVREQYFDTKTGKVIGKEKVEKIVNKKEENK